MLKQITKADKATFNKLILELFVTLRECYKVKEDENIPGLGASLKVKETAHKNFNLLEGIKDSSEEIHSSFSLIIEKNSQNNNDKVVHYFEISEGNIRTYQKAINEGRFIKAHISTLNTIALSLGYMGWMGYKMRFSKIPNFVRLTEDHQPVNEGNIETQPISDGQDSSNENGKPKAKTLYTKYLIAGIIVLPFVIATFVLDLPKKAFEFLQYYPKLINLISAEQTITNTSTLHPKILIAGFEDQAAYDIKVGLKNLISPELPDVTIEEVDLHINSVPFNVKMDSLKKIGIRENALVIIWGEYDPIFKNVQSRLFIPNGIEYRNYLKDEYNFKAFKKTEELIFEINLIQHPKLLSKIILGINNYQKNNITETIGHLEDARSILEEYQGRLTSGIKEKELLMLLGYCYIYEYSNVTAFVSSSTNNPNHLSVWDSKSGKERNLNLNLLKKAEALFLEFLDQNANDSHGLTFLAQTYYLLGNYNESIKLYEKAKSINPNDSIYINKNMASAYIGLKDYFSAIKFIKYSYLGENEQSNRLVCNLGFCYEQINEVDSAISYYQKAYYKNKTASVLFSLSNFYKNQGKIDKSLGYVVEGLSMYPNDNRFNHLMGLIQLSKKNYSNALNNFKKIPLRNDSTYNSGLCAFKAKCLLEMDLINDSFDQANQSISYQENYYAHLTIGNIHLIHNKEDEAINYYKKARRYYSGSISDFRKYCIENAPIIFINYGVTRGYYNSIINKV